MPTFRSSQRRCSIKKLFLKFRNISRKAPVLQSFKKETPTQFLRTLIFKYIYEQLFLYFRILKKFFLKNEKNGKSKTRKSRKKSRKNYSEFSYFRVFDFALQPKSKTRIWNSWKKISEISELSTWPCQLSITFTKNSMLWIRCCNLRFVAFFLNHSNYMNVIFWNLFKNGFTKIGRNGFFYSP